ncbi:hypothetical protein [Neomegalonema sp.]|uniref:hypothetical protein n=1 Tax=Neomegalonema sp. TaxID=2039713 RepID=UPI00260E436C|nr:hypothetical protein [Neomegalonema sp.]MDD2869655.1 hypothetical protein [Neomegalonema sp.]
MAKSDDTEIEMRVNEIVSLIIQGEPKRNIVQGCSQKWNVSERQIYTYYSRANEYFKECAKLDRDTELGKAYNQYVDLYKMAKDKKDYNGARQILKDLLETFGYKVNRTELTGKDGTPLIKQVIKFGDKEIEF